MLTLYIIFSVSFLELLKIINWRFSYFGMIQCAAEIKNNTVINSIASCRVSHSLELYWDIMPRPSWAEIRYWSAQNIPIGRPPLRLYSSQRLESVFETCDLPLDLRLDLRLKHKDLRLTRDSTLKTLDLLATCKSSCYSRVVIKDELGNISTWILMLGLALEVTD